MNLLLSELLTVKQNFEKILEQKLLEMDVWFQEHMWDGSGDEDDPIYLTKDDFEAIEALTDKIKHMTLYIGCPNSVSPMIESIITRKIKRWLGNDPLMGSSDDIHKSTYNKEKQSSQLKKVFVGFHKGKQIKTDQELARVRKSHTYYNDPVEVLVGHFRWNNRGYILSRRATDLLEEYYHNHF